MVVCRVGIGRVICMYIYTSIEYIREGKVVCRLNLAIIDLLYSSYTLYIHTTLHMMSGEVKTWPGLEDTHAARLV